MPAPDIDSKLDALHAELRRLGRVVVAFSGGADSAFLAFEAQQVLLLAMATLTAQAVALAVALRIATRVTADANRSFLEFRQIKRLD